MEATQDYLTCDWSGAGIEFYANIASNEADMSFTVNFIDTGYNTTPGCYFRVYVDDIEYENENTYYFSVQDSSIKLKGLTQGLHKIRIVKITGFKLALCNLVAVTFEGTISDIPPADKSTFIEIVGDSITCGWGLIGNHDGSYLSQDVTQAYSYLVAEKLNADYSIVGVSGQALTFGDPKIPDAYKYTSRSTVEEYSFARKADIVIINADTNNALSGTATSLFKPALKEFAQYARQKNKADTKIIIVCGMIEEVYFETVASVVAELGGEANGYYYYKANPCSPNTAYGGHPNELEHKLYANDLVSLIKGPLAMMPMDHFQAACDVLRTKGCSGACTSKDLAVWIRAVASATTVHSGVSYTPSEDLYACMPMEDYAAACDAIRSALSISDLITSDELATYISQIVGVPN